MFKARDPNETLAADLAVTIEGLRAVTGELAKWNDRMRLRYPAAAASSPRRKAPEPQTP